MKAKESVDYGGTRLASLLAVAFIIIWTYLTIKSPGRDFENTVQRKQLAETQAIRELLEEAKK